MSPCWSRFIICLLWLLAHVCGAANVPPQFSGAPTVAPFRAGGTARTIDIAPLFRDPDVTGTVVRMSLRLGTVTKTVDLALYDQQTPQTVANFLRYVRDGKYQSSFFHRSVAGFVLQGGGFYWSSTGVSTIVTYPAVLNEPGISNLRGTIAMAKLGNDANSATDQWFVNLADNSANLDAQNGGFTVFGRVLGTGMSVVDEIAALPTVNAGSPFDSLPVKDFTGNSVQRANTIETTGTAEIAALSFSVSSSDSGLLAVSLTGTTLRLTPGSSRSGTVQVTIHATDLDGATADGVFSVQVQPRSAGWSSLGQASSAGPERLAFDPASTAGLSGDSLPVALGPVTIGRSRSRSVTLQNNSAAALTGLTLTKQGNQAADFAITGGLDSPTLAAGASATITVTCTPSATGVRAATVRLATGNPDEPSFDLSFSATGREPGPPVISGVAPQVLQANGQGSAVVPDYRGTTVIADDPDGIATFTQSPEPGSILTAGSSTLSFTATNAGGLAATAQTTLMVQYARPLAVQAQPIGGYVGAPLPTGAPAGSIVSVFGTPALSDLRDLGARVTLTVGRTKVAAIYLENGHGESRLVAQQHGDSGLAGAPFLSFLDPVLSSQGRIAFAAKLAGPKPGADQGVWTDLFGTLQPVLREGLPLPGLGNLKLKAVTSLSLEDDALLALVKLLPQAGVVTVGVSDTALVRITGPNAGTLLVRTGVSFDGSPVKQLSVLQPAARSVGQGRWQNGAAVVVKMTLQDHRIVLARLAVQGAQTKLLQAVSPDPLFPTRLSLLGLPALGGSSVAVLATKAVQPGITAASNTALLVAPHGTDFAEALPEDSSAGTTGGARFASFSDPVANDRGGILFYATVRAGTGPGANSAGLWRWDETGLGAPTARLGGTATAPDGTLLPDAAWSAITSFALPDGPGAGPVFVAQLAGRGVKPQTNTGLWATDSHGVVRLLLRKGGQVPLPTGDKTVAAFTTLNSLPGSFGTRRSYNATGSIAVQVTYTDGTQGLLRLDVP